MLKLAMIPALLLLSILVSCVYSRSDGTTLPSRAFDRPGDTENGRRFAARSGEHPGDSALYVLGNGLDAFAARVAIIDGAEHAVDAQYYIYHDDVTGDLLLQRMLLAADRGVRVRLLIDDVGTSGIDDILGAANVHPNLEVRLFNPRARGPWNGLAKTLDMLRRPRRLNHRMHNKLLSGDGLVAVVGGRNIGDEYFDATEGVNFSDLDLVAAGPVVAEVGEQFDLYWNCEYAKRLDDWRSFASDEDDLAELERQLAERHQAALDSPYVERLRATGLVQDILSGDIPVYWAPTLARSDLPSKIVADSDEIEATLLTTRLGEALPQARSDLLIVSPYFVPRASGVEHLVDAVRRGVRVRVLTNSLAATDVPAVHAGYKQYRRALLEGNVELYELQPAGDLLSEGYSSGVFGSSNASLHAKTFLIDQRHVFVGSLNLDPRSVELNTELGLVVNSKALAADLIEGIEKALAPSASWRLSLVNGDLVWTGLRDGRMVELHTEPDTSWWTRSKTWFLGLLPIEGQI